MLDLGLSVFKKCRVRLHGIDCSELRRGTDVQKQHGLAAKNFCITALPPGSQTIVTTIKDKGKYGRMLGVIGLGDTTVNEALIQADLAVRYTGQDNESKNRELAQCLDRWLNGKRVS